MGPAAAERITKDPIDFESVHPETDTSEFEFEPWGDKQRLLVEVNQDVIVPCPWMDGAEVTLSTAMNNYPYPPNLTAEDEPFLIAVVEELLANRIDREEPEEVTEPDELILGLDETEEAAAESEAIQVEDEEQKSDDTSSDDRPSRAKEPTARVVAKEEPTRHINNVEDGQSEAPRISKDESLLPVSEPKVAPDAPVAALEKPKETFAVEVPEDIYDSIPLEGDKVQATEVLEPSPPPIAPETLASELPDPEAIQDPQIAEAEGSPPPAEVSTPQQPANLAVEIENLTLLAKDLAVPIDSVEIDIPEAKSAPTEIAKATRDGEIEDLWGEEEEVGQPIIPQPLPESLDAETQKERALVVEPEEDLQVSIDREVDQRIEEKPREVVVSAEASDSGARKTEPCKSQEVETADDYIDRIIKKAAAIEQLRDKGLTEEPGEVFEKEKESLVGFDQVEIEVPDVLGRGDYPSSRPIRHLVEVPESDEELEDQEVQSGGIGVLTRPTQGFVAADAFYHDRLISRIALELCGFRISFSLN